MEDTVHFLVRTGPPQKRNKRKAVAYHSDEDEDDVGVHKEKSPSELAVSASSSRDSLAARDAPAKQVQASSAAAAAKANDVFDVLLADLLTHLPDTSRLCACSEHSDHVRWMVALLQSFRGLSSQNEQGCKDLSECLFQFLTRAPPAHFWTHELRVASIKLCSHLGRGASLIPIKGLCAYGAHPCLQGNGCATNKHPDPESDTQEPAAEQAPVDE